MNKVIFMAICLALTHFLAFAQSSVWKVSKGENTLYLGGSIHVLRTSDFPLPKEFDATFAKSDIVVFEANLDEASDPKTAQKILSLAMLPQGNSLKSILSDKTYKRVEAKCAELGLPIEYLSQFTPFMAISTLTMAQLESMGFIYGGVDSHYLLKAKQVGKKLDYFETLEYQMSLFNVNMKHQDEFVMQSLSDLEPKKLQMMVSTIISEWKKGIATHINIEIADMKSKFPNIYKIMITDRNQAWLTKIERYLSTKDIEFVIAGFGHMVGDEGLLELLKSKGYKIE
jgi:uncharacterized protein YbaP (TraB family)